MKYLVIILTIILTITAATFLFVWPDQPKGKKDVLVTINGHDITRSDIQVEGATGSHHENSGDFINSVINKQLLIQEAQKHSIDQEPSFRKELKDYYEQSLIKILMERKYASVQVQVSDGEVENFLGSFGKTYTFMLLKTRELLTVDFLKKNGTLHSALFEDLSENLQLILANLKPGEMAMEFETGNENSAILLEKIEGTGNRSSLISPVKARKILEEHKKRQIITNWINDLRRNASITLQKQKEQP
jgi:hypothetical protein